MGGEVGDEGGVEGGGGGGRGGRWGEGGAEEGRGVERWVGLEGGLGGGLGGGWDVGGAEDVWAGALDPKPAHRAGCGEGIHTRTHKSLHGLLPPGRIWI